MIELARETQTSDRRLCTERGIMDDDAEFAHMLAMADEVPEEMPEPPEEPEGDWEADSRPAAGKRPIGDTMSSAAAALGKRPRLGGELRLLDEEDGASMHQDRFPMASDDDAASPLNDDRAPSPPGDDDMEAETSPPPPPVLLSRPRIVPPRIFIAPPESGSYVSVRDPNDSQRQYYLRMLPNEPKRREVRSLTRRCLPANCS